MQNSQDVVKENAKMFIDPEKLGIYQAVKEHGEAIGLAQGEARGEARGLAKGEARGLRKMVLKLLAKLPPEQVADLTGMPLAEVQAIAAADKA